MADSPWAGITNLGALDQKLYQQPPPEPASPSPTEAKQDAAVTVRPRKRATATETPATTPDKHANSQPQSRPLIRRTFDYYEDQIAYLKQTSLREKIDGNEVGMAEMLREAVDEWIKKRKATK